MTIDRMTPRERPEGRPSGYQRWRDLLFLHWPVDVDAVRAAVPASLELDLWDGRAWVGLVPFAMEGVRPWWLPRFAALSFLETNLRTYVVCNGEPGVYFFSLEAASWLAVKAARVGWGLPYFHADMAMQPSTGDDEPWAYESVRKGDPTARLHVEYAPGAPLGPSQPGSTEFFFLERYLLFSESPRKPGQVMRGQVHHVPYPVRSARVLDVDEGLLEAAGLPAAEGAPALAHFSDGVDVEVFGPEPTGPRAQPTASGRSGR